MYPRSAGHLAGMTDTYGDERDDEREDDALDDRERKGDGEEEDPDEGG